MQPDEDDARRQFWDAFDRGSEALAADPQALVEVEAERAGEAESLRDGVE